MSAAEISLNESAEDLLTMTVNESMERELNPQVEAENVRKYIERSGGAGMTAGATPGKRVGTRVPTERPVKLMGRNVPLAHRTEDKENVANESSANAARPRDSPGPVTRSPAAMNAAVKSKRATPKQRKGTGRAVTTRPVEFRRRAAEQAEERHEPEPEPVRELLPTKGRRTGIRMKHDIPKDEFGLEDLTEFWDAEVVDEPEPVEVALPSSAVKSTRRVSFMPSQSPASQRVSTTGRNSTFMDPSTIRASTTGRSSMSSIRSSMSVAGSSVHDQSLSGLTDEGLSSVSIAGSDARSQALSVMTDNSMAEEDDMQMDDQSPPQSSRRSSMSSVGRRISQRISTGGKGLNSLATIDAYSVASSTRSSASKGSMLDSSILSPDANNTIKQLTFDEGSARRKSSSSSRASSAPAEDAEQEMEVEESHNESMEEEAPEFDEPEDQQESPEKSAVQEDLADDDEEEDERDVEAQDESVKQTQKRKREDAATRKRELEALAKTGRASYLHTDSYAPKKSRLSMVAPRPVTPDDNTRKSKRRKMRPLEYWRNERVFYQRANKSPKTPSTAEANARGYKLTAKSAVPEIVDVLIRSPEPTPWRRKYKKDQEEVPEASSSVDSKSATIKKKARAQKKKDNKAGKRKVEAEEQSDGDNNNNQEEEQEQKPSPKYQNKKSKMASVSPIARAKKTPQKENNADAKRKTAFFLFCKERRPDVRRMNPDASIPEQAMILSEMWRGLNDAAKNVYKSMQTA